MFIVTYTLSVEKKLSVIFYEVCTDFFPAIYSYAQDQGRHQLLQ